MNRKQSEWVRKKKLEILARLSPEKATKNLYRRVFGRELNLERPRYFCEKLHYLKLNDYYNNPLVTACIDKYTVKNFMDCIGKSELCPKLYGVYKKAWDINWNELPEKFIVKCTHGCGYNIICHDKLKFNTSKAEKQLSLWLKEDYWVKYVETQYRFINKKIIIEEYLGDNLITYRFCCFNGEPKLIYVMTEEKDKNYIDYFDVNWNRLEYRWKGRTPDPVPIARPKLLEEMLETARLLSKGFPFVRIDLYETDNRIYLSEFTFLPAGGIMVFEKRSVSRLLGSWIEIK